MFKKIEVYDPPMCCSSGCCGTSVDPALPRFAADLDWLKKAGVSVERFNLTQQPAAFTQNPDVKGTLDREGSACLPLILAGGEIVSSGVYPSREQLGDWAGIQDAAGEGPCCTKGCCC